jgi:2,5-diketo-D-gluconate reductase A
MFIALQGTGGYASKPNGTANNYPECWSEPNCGNYTSAAVKTWLLTGGRRLDAANSYGDMKSVGIGLAASGVAREDVFLLQKVGNSLSMGYNDVMLQFDDILQQMNVTYVDLLLIHWPTSPASK